MAGWLYPSVWLISAGLLAVGILAGWIKPNRDHTPTNLIANNHWAFSKQWLEISKSWAPLLPGEFVGRVPKTNFAYVTAGVPEAAMLSYYTLHQ